MQLDRVRRTALAVAVLSAVGAIAASTGAASTAPQPLASNSVTSLNGDGGTTTGPSGASDQTGPSGAPGSPSATGVTGTSGARSEEHTSELQSLRHLACRLLLE